MYVGPVPIWSADCLSVIPSHEDPFGRMASVSQSSMKGASVLRQALQIIGAFIVLSHTVERSADAHAEGTAQDTALVWGSAIIALQ